MHRLPIGEQRDGNVVNCRVTCEQHSGQPCGPAPTISLAARARAFAIVVLACSASLTAPGADAASGPHRSHASAHRRGPREASGAAISEATPLLTGGPPRNIQPPAISGEAVQFQALKTTTGGWEGTALEYSYSWKSCDAEGECSEQAGPANTYMLSSSDVGNTLQVTVTASDAGGEAQATSSRSAIVRSASGGVGVGWGEDWFGNLGTIYRTVDEASHVPIAEGLGGIKSLAAGESSGYALLDSGEAVAFGANGHGQLGDDSEDHSYFDEKSDVPVEQELGDGQIVPLTGIQSISPAGDHALALLENGTVKTWGSNGSGQMGRGTGGFEHETHERTVLATTVSSLSRHALAERGLPEVVAVQGAGGDDFAILANGEVMGWGNDEYGQTGVGPPHYEADGTTIVKSELCHTEAGFERCIKEPRPVVLANGEPLLGVAALTGGTASTYALLGDGQVMAWGSNANGQLGRGMSAPAGTHTRNAPPAPVVEAAGEPLSGVRSVTAGDTHALALRANGEVVGWGDGEQGELGNAPEEECGAGAGPDDSGALRRGKGGAHQCVRFATRVIAADGLRPGRAPIREISAGGKFNLAVDSAGRVYSWGSDSDSQLGDASTNSSGRASPKLVNEPGPVIQAVTGEKFALTLLREGTPTAPAPLAIQRRVGAFDVTWGFAAERLLYHVGRRTEPGDPSERPEFSLQETGPPEDVLRPAIEFHNPEEIAEEGLELSAERGQWSGERPFTISIRWQRCPAGVSEAGQLDEQCENLSRQTLQHETGERSEDEYIPEAADVGHTLRFLVTIRDQYVPEGGGAKVRGEASLPSETTGEVQRASAGGRTEQIKATAIQERLITALKGEPLRQIPYEIDLDQGPDTHPRIMRATPLAKESAG